MPSADFLELYAYIHKLLDELPDNTPEHRATRRGIVMIWNYATKMMDMEETRT